MAVVDEVKSNLSIKWLGAAGIELRAGEQVLLTDPFFTRPSLWQVLFSRLQSNAELVARHVERADFVLATHSHYDHVMDIPTVMERTGAQAYGSPNTCWLLELHGMSPERVHPICPGDQIRLGAFDVQVLAGRHLNLPGYRQGPLAPNLKPPLRAADYRMDTCLSFLILVGGLRLLNWHNTRPGPAPSADVLLLGPDVSHSDYGQLLAAVKPRLIIPIHWDDFFQPLSKPLRPFWRVPSLANPTLERNKPQDVKLLLEAASPGTLVQIPYAFMEYTLDGLVEQLHRPAPDEETQ